MPRKSVISNLSFIYLTTCCLIVILSVKLSSAFPSGAPADACENLTPRHTGAKAITDHSPYTLKAISNCILM
uniref:Uncharacterized protein n=1 Tax=Tetranychus urticae TaxID=32264 RepID=T1JRL9_TETUR